MNPVAIDLTVPVDYRIARAGECVSSAPAQLTAENTWTFEGVRVVDVITAIEGAAAQGVGTALIFAAIDRARRLGWIAKTQAEAVRSQMETNHG